MIIALSRAAKNLLRLTGFSDGFSSYTEPIAKELCQNIDINMSKYPHTLSQKSMSNKQLYDL